MSGGGSSVSEDRWADLRKALSDGPTSGPWSVTVDFDDAGGGPYTYIGVERQGDGPSRYWPICEVDSVAGVDLSYDWGTEAKTATYIAATDPDTIAALLAERDALASALRAAIEGDPRIDEPTGLHIHCFFCGSYMLEGGGVACGREGERIAHEDHCSWVAGRAALSEGAP